MSYKDAEGIEGPYWDFSAAFQWARDEKNGSACLCTQKLLQGSSSDAHYWAERFAEDLARCVRIIDRYHAITEGPDAVRWIGWDRL